jgi:3-hydroxyacyl-CoA dehydrogenase/enoyl-CoA hydratase/3-hydroxybutyryl-CoA epimerase
LLEFVRSVTAAARLRGLLVAIDELDSPAAPPSPDIQAVCNGLATLPCTTVATIRGRATGRYLELALACDYRLAADDAKVLVGLPEVSIGLIPGGGGMQRLPRLIGLTHALDLILRGRRLNALQARRVGLLDAIVSADALDATARAWARRRKRRSAVPRGGGFIGLAERTGVGRRIVFDRARRMLPRGYPAPLKALEVIEIGYRRGIAAGLAAEARAVRELAATATARNLTWLSNAGRQQRARFRSSGATRLAVVSGSSMGAAINEIVGAGHVALADADLVVVAARDDLEHQCAAVRDVEASVRLEAVIAVNTSALPIGDIVASASHPERIVGTRFIAPVQRTRLLEVVQPESASESAVAMVAALGTRLDKTVIVVGDGPGFFVSRVLGLMLNEAALLVDECAPVEAVDRAMTRFGFATGPLRLLDEIGLAVAQRMADQLALDKTVGDRVPRSRSIADLAASGSTGRHSGAGFYRWRNRSPLDRVLRRPRRSPNPAVYRGESPRAVEESAVQTRLVALFVNECIRCLEDGVLRSSTDGDLGAVLGIGFPPFLGGPFHYTDSIGPRVLIDKLQRLADMHGNRFIPANLLLDYARDGRSFFEEWG